MQPLKRVLILVLGALFAWGVVSLWPVRWAFSPGFLTANHLLVFTNEAEARPCGGFITAVGEFRVLPPRFQIRNSYALPEHSLGPPHASFSEITNNKTFWDLGTRKELDRCARDLKQAYLGITGKEQNRVLMIDFGTIEALLGVLGPIDLDGENVAEKDLFARLSRQVANVDRHDANALQARKSVLGSLAKTLPKSILLRPLKWRKIGKMVQTRVESGAIYAEQITPPKRWEDAFHLVEWNAGGAKSSRYLEKHLFLDFREKSPQDWQVDVRLWAQHLGGVDEPLSQDWSGVLELHFPRWLDAEVVVERTKIPPGGRFEKAYSLAFKGDLPADFTLLSARGQAYNADVSVSVFPQKTITTSAMTAREGVATWSGPVVGAGARLIFAVEKDTTPPFLTLHKAVNGATLPAYLRAELAENDILVEVHFSEKVALRDHFYAELLDKDKVNARHHTDAYLLGHYLLSDKRTLLLSFEQKTPQPEEHYYLRLFGVEDFFGNAYRPGAHTVITKKQNEKP